MTDDRVRHDSVVVNGPQVSKHRGHDGSQDPTADCATVVIRYSLTIVTKHRRTTFTRMQ